MARSRNIKPGYFKNEELADCDPLARLVFAGLWTIADREGRLEDRPKRIKVDILPYDNADMDALLEQLVRHGFILRYQANGLPYIQIAKWSCHQQPHIKEAPSVIPPPQDYPVPTLLYKEEEPDKYDASTVLVPVNNVASTELKSLNPSSLNLDSLLPVFGAVDEPPPKQRRKQRIPPDFCLTEAMIVWAKSKGFDKLLDLEKETDEFTDYWRGRGEPMLDWVATWQSRIRNRADYVKGKVGGNGNGTYRQNSVEIEGSGSQQKPANRVPGLREALEERARQTRGA